MEYKYCETCGLPLIKKLWLSQYDMFDGSEIYYVFAYCPKYERENFFWEFWRINNHTGVCWGNKDIPYVQAYKKTKNGSLIPVSVQIELNKMPIFVETLK